MGCALLVNLRGNDYNNKLHVNININNIPFAANDHVVQNLPCWRAISLLFVHWDITTKASQPSLVQVSLSQCGNSNKLALQHGGFCTTRSLVAKGL